MTVTAGDPYPERELTQGLGPRRKIPQRYRTEPNTKRKKKKSTK